MLLFSIDQSFKRLSKLVRVTGTLENLNLAVNLIFWCFNATFSNISVILWRPVLVVEEAGDSHRPWASNW
jgi:hypothetical protein